MDEVSALKMIFKQHFSVDDDGIISIRNNTKTYEIDSNAMKIIDAKREYKDIYDYIANDMDEAEVDVQRGSTVGFTEEVIDKITEEQFYEWKNSRSCTGEETNNDMTGKDIWLNKLAGDDID